MKLSDYFSTALPLTRRNFLKLRNMLDMHDCDETTSGGLTFDEVKAQRLSEFKEFCHRMNKEEGYGALR